jgi:hypothetical protein
MCHRTQQILIGTNGMHACSLKRELPQDCTSDGPYTSLLRVVNAMSARTAAALLGSGRRADMCMRSGTRQL